MPTIALILAGQLRDHFSKVFALLNATLLSMPDFDVDVFACVWETLGKSVHGGHSSSENHTSVTTQPWQLYGRKLAMLRVERSSNSEQASLKLHNLSLPTGLAEAAGHWSRSTLSHLWLQHCCRQELLLASTNYHAVVTIRPDSKFWTPAVAAGLVWSVRHLDSAAWRDNSSQLHRLELFLSPFALCLARVG